MHINTQTLHRFLAQTLGEQEQSRIEAHLATCKICSEHLTMLRRSFANTTSGELARPSASLVQRSIAAFQKFQTQRPDRVQRIARCCTKGEQQARAGLRSAVQENQFLYTMQSYDIDIRQSFDQHKNRFDLHGQILPHKDQVTEWAGHEVCLTDAANLQRLRITDALGEFTFSYITEGVYSLLISLNAEDIIVEPIVVKQRPLQ